MKNNINFVQVFFYNTNKTFLFFEIDYPSTDGTHENLVLQKIVALRNTGNMKATIRDISFGHSKCSGQGFSVYQCSNIEIEPNERYDLRIR
jgi:hypothetical protein